VLRVDEPRRGPCNQEQPKWLYLYWAYALARAEEIFKVTRFPPGICGAQAEREYVTLDPKKITCLSCRERAKAKSESEHER
jgi:hypothetical protein